MTRAPSLLELCVSRRGLVKGALVAEFVAEWAIAQAECGDDMTVSEFARSWKDRERTAWRRLKDFRATFPELGEHGTPTQIAKPVADDIRRRQLDRETARREALGLGRVAAV